MNLKEMERIKTHFEQRFEQPVECVFHPKDNNIVHIDVLCFAPTELYPFWKLVTMGASEIMMPQKDKYGSNRNEYVIFVDKEVDILNDYGWYINWLCMTAEYTYVEKQFVTFNHVVQMPNVTDDGEMKGVVLLLPAVMYDGSILRCKTGLFKQCTCLQIIPVTQAEIDGAQVNGYEWLVNKFYPFIYGGEEHQNDEEHYLAEKIRTF